MPNPRGAISPEQIADEVREAAEEMKGCQTIDDLRALWRKRYLRIGHKALARIFIGQDAEIVAQRASASASRMQAKG